MDNFFSSYYLLGMFHGNLPAHQGIRHKRYQSIAKMLDLIDVVKRLKPKIPMGTLFLDRLDDEWDDDMTYLEVEYDTFYHSLAILGLWGGVMLYNFNLFFYNKMMGYFSKAACFMTFFYGNHMYFKYRKQMLKANLFDEYVQMRADELIKQNEHLLRADNVKRYVWFMEDLKETLSICDRQAYNNNPTDFADAELLLQDFIRRYTDETDVKPLKSGIHDIGPVA